MDEYVPREEEARWRLAESLGLEPDPADKAKVLAFIWTQLAESPAFWSPEYRRYLEERKRQLEEE